MENTQTAYTEADKEAVRILRAAYMESTASDTLYNARQYLQDRARYERNMLHCVRRRWMDAMKTKEKA